MMHEEFTTLVGKDVSLDEYSVIEKVYTWHPSISATEGKKQIAMLYKEFGMAVINAMIETADIAQSIDSEERCAVTKLNAIKERRIAVQNGNIQFEKCRNDICEWHRDSNSSEEYENVLSKLMKKYNVDLVNEARESLEL